MTLSPPLVLCLSGHDPTGGAGVQADHEAIAAQGGHALSLITALTAQDTRDVRTVVATDAGLLGEQLALLEADCCIAAIKIGLLGSAAQVAVIVAAIERLRVPVVLDPVLRAGGGTNLVQTELETAVLTTLLPHVTVLTPNAAEARRLAPAATLGDSAQALLALGCANVLITGGDEPDAQVRNTWHRADHAPIEFRWPRLPETFHGAGCTLASAIAARLACGDPLDRALATAQRWTQEALARAIAVGRGRRIPRRH